MRNLEQISFPQKTQPLNTSPADRNGLFSFFVPDYMTTGEAVVYLRVSRSYFLRQDDIPFLKGKPNIYKRSDLDDWFERNKFKPELNENIENIETIETTGSHETYRSKSI